jgi:hypothetical protein
MYIFLYFFTFFFLLPMITVAQYAPQEKSAGNMDLFIADVIAFILGAVKFLIGVWALYILFIAFIATILFFTSGGDENRMDRAIEWWKKCAIGIILAPLIYIFVSFLGNVLKT